MIGQKKGEDINDAIKGPIGYFGLGMILIAVVMAFANDWNSNMAPPDEPILFGGFIVDVIYEIKFYMYAIIPLIMIAGSILVGMQLKIHPNGIANIKQLTGD